MTTKVKTEIQFTVETDGALTADQAQELADAIATIATPGEKYRATPARFKAMKFCESVGLRFILAFADID